jgi:segregation and condensation protein B
MAKKKAQQAADESAAKTADLSNLIDAAKTSLFQFSEEVEMASDTTQLNAEAQAEVEALATEIHDAVLASPVEAAAGAEVADIFDSSEIEDIQESMELLSEPLPIETSEEDMADDELAKGGLSSNEFVANNDNECAEVLLDNTMEEDAVFGELMGSNEGSTIDSLESQDVSSELQGTELEGFASAAIEELEFVEESQLESIVESVLFATDRPVSFATLKQIFKGTNVTNARLKRAIETLQVEYAGGRRGVTLEEVGSGYQLRTKIDNMEFMRRSFKAKSFKLSGPALEVLAIVAYKQPVVKAEIDEIRGVESGHLLRALMEKNLVLFAGKSDLPGKPMQYGTARKFLEIFGLRNLKELPTLSQIDELLPEGIGDEEQKPKLADITDGLSEQIGQSYSEGEEELTKITDQLEKIDTSSEFFEKEKLRQKQEKEAEKARNLREAIAVGESVSTRDINWLKRYDEQLAQGVSAPVVENAEAESVAAEPVATLLGAIDESAELEAALQAWDAEDEGVSQRLEDNDLADIDEEIV